MSVITVTRVINATVLVALPGGTVLTDPYFTDHWFMRFSEPVGVSVDQLPKLSAIIGGHQVFDHWQPSSLRHYPYRDTTPVYVANRRMARSARKAGFCQVEVLRWGNQRAVDPDLTITSVPGERITGGRTNSYIVTSAGTSVFIGTEARSIETIRLVASEHGVDVAMLPVNGARLLGRRLVMDLPTAIHAAELLGAHTLIPIHYTQRAIPPLLTARLITADELETALPKVPPLKIAVLPPGRPARLCPQPPASPKLPQSIPGTLSR